jgi:hypothetical protein
MPPFENIFERIDNPARQQCKLKPVYSRLAAAFQKQLAE